MPILETVTGVLPMLFAVSGVIKGSKFVQENERGVKLRFGKVVRRNSEPKIIGPGFCFVIPGIEHLHRTHVRERTLNTGNQTVVLSDRMVFEVGAMALVKVQDDDDAIYRALFEVIDLNDSIIDYSGAVLRELLSASTYEQVLDPTDLLSRAKDQIRVKLATWGVDLIDFMLTDCAPSDQTGRALLTNAEAHMRAEALIQQADSLVASSAAKLSPTVAAALIGAPVSVALRGNECRHHHADDCDADDS